MSSSLMGGVGGGAVSAQCRHAAEIQRGFEEGGRSMGSALAKERPAFSRRDSVRTRELPRDVESRALVEVRTAAMTKASKS